MLRNTPEERRSHLNAIALNVHILYVKFCLKTLAATMAKISYYRAYFIFIARSQFSHVNPFCADTRTQERMTYEHMKSASPALCLQPRVAICHLSPANGYNNLLDHCRQSCAYFNSYILWRILIKSDGWIFS
jgi:hypothetical protein